MLHNLVNFRSFGVIFRDWQMCIKTIGKVLVEQSEFHNVEEC